MRVAQARGAAFTRDREGGWAPAGWDATQALEDVAAALGYANSEDYNRACVARPLEVERRLKKLGGAATRTTRTPRRRAGRKR